jgi:hypothetical protein
VLRVNLLAYVYNKPGKRPRLAQLQYGAGPPTTGPIRNTGTDAGGLRSSRCYPVLGASCQLDCSACFAARALSFFSGWAFL